MIILFVSMPYSPWAEETRRVKTIHPPRALFEVGCRKNQDDSFVVLDLDLVIRKGISIGTAVKNAVRNKSFDLIMITMPTFVHGAVVSKVLQSLGQNHPPVILGGGALSLIKDAPRMWWPQISSCCANQDQDLADHYDPEEFYALKGNLDLDNLLSDYRTLGLDPAFLLELSRGCAFNCDFCAINRSRMRFQSRSPRTVLSEIEYLSRKGIRRFGFIDPTFGLDRVRTEELLEGMNENREKWGNCEFEVITRPEVVTDEFALALSNAGVIQCGLGMETMEERDLQSVQKKLQLSRLRAAITALAVHGIEAKLFHLLFPGRISVKTVQFLLELQEEGIKFSLQSSFLRSLPTPDSKPNFLSHDRTVITQRETEDQLFEWMLTNLAFCSISTGGNGDEELRKAIRDNIAKGRPLTSLFTGRYKLGEVWLLDKYVWLNRRGPIQLNLYRR